MITPYHVFLKEDFNFQNLIMPWSYTFAGYCHALFIGSNSISKSPCIFPPPFHNYHSTTYNKNIQISRGLPNYWSMMNPRHSIASDFINISQHRATCQGKSLLPGATCSTTPWARRSWYCVCG